jgi:hypothetical protein
MNKVSSSGRLKFYIDESSQYSETISEIEAAFSIDKSFHAGRNLVEELLKLLALLSGSSRQARWILALQEIQNNGQKGKGGGWKKVAKGSRNAANPLSGHMTNYRVASFILQQAVDTQYEDIVLALKLLYLEIVIKDPLDHKLFTTATTLRKTVINFYFSVDSLIEFSADDLVTYFKDFKIKTASSVGFINELHSIIDFLLAKRSLKEVPSVDEKESTSPAKKPSFLGERTSHFDTLPAELNVGNANLRVRSFIQAGSPEAAPPAQINFISLDSAEADSAIQVEVKINESKYWLRRHQNLVAGEWGRFTPTERRTLSDYIETNIVSCDSEKQKVAGLIALIYLTGRSVEDLLGCEVGDGATFSKEGIYIRDVSRPVDAWGPSDMQEQYLESVATTLALQLPIFLAGWILKYVGTSKMSLAEALNLDLDKAGERVKRVLEEVHQNGQFYRIRLERIQSALALEATLMFQDEVVTYQLTSTVHHAPPMLAYYVAHDAQYISSCYEQITAQMVAS